ncbi:hypothetical protein AGDE_14200 [Angomonas deanei]|uniref:Uncharacterized protein n=1 Tax=Angomonas deanei TaxID=59799 RepID=A0A7G2CMF9_9TRYP|nr:hypothetical protein AGDE_14200 [Angomonas deanei]CAD2221030.1 hypothetical protein, conserved [Angomonas deanei]|eukprot:EPY21227.1 hypothetical protein AGDE_14200 [Angomonas deanei]
MSPCFAARAAVCVSKVHRNLYLYFRFLSHFFVLRYNTLVTHRFLQLYCMLTFVPSFRRYALLELPFTLQAENNNNEKVNEFHKREITKFIPAHLVAPSLLQDTDQKSHHKNINKNELTASALRDSLQNNDTNENREDGVSSLDSPAFSSSRSSSSWSSEEDDNRSKDETPENEDNKDSHNNTFLKPHSYSTKSVLDFNRGVASSLSSLFGEKEKKMEPNKKNEKKEEYTTLQI